MVGGAGVSLITMMNKYLLINHGKGTEGDWDAFFEMLNAGSHLIGGSSLGRGMAVRGGVFSEALSQTITGYIVIQAESLERAKEIALKCPVHQTGGTVELFTLVES